MLQLLLKPLIGVASNAVSGFIETKKLKQEAKVTKIKADTKFFKSTGADIIGMTLVPECQLAREAQICYVSISTVTDYDVWAEKPVTAKEVLETLSKNVEKTKELLTVLIDKIPKTKSCDCEKALSEAVF